jgi:AcrR family transcriptional regulator
VIRVTAARCLRSEESAEDRPPPVVSVVADPDTEVSHNLNGQKLGRKGRDTRERILAATAELLARPDAEAISMSAVARKASLGMTSLYNYFTDFTELLLAVLEPVIAEGEGVFTAMLSTRWPDDELDARCMTFLRAYHDFWARHTRLLHLRNAMADTHDQRMMLHRVRSAQPIIALLLAQMDDDPGLGIAAPTLGMATVLMTGMERTVTVSTDDRYTQLLGPDRRRQPDHYLVPEARLMALAIRDTRARVKAGRG